MKHVIFPALMSAALLFSISAFAQTPAIVIPYGDDAIVYSGNAPIVVVNDASGDTGTISFDVTQMPELPTSKLPSIDLHQPSLGVYCTIALTGVFPSRSGANPLLGQINYVGFNFPPRGWAFCDGQILPINQFSALFSLLGTAFGGDGRTTFGLPDMRGRVPVHPGTGPGLPTRSWGQKFGRPTEPGL